MAMDETIKLLPGPRQPFVGLVAAAVCGILLGDFLQVSQFTVSVGILVIVTAGLLLLCWPNLVLTYVFVICSFFLLHTIWTANTPGLLLASRLSDRPRVVTATGVVMTEPKIAPNGFATFLFKLKSIELEEKTEPTTATILARWRGDVQFGAELKLFGVAAPIAPGRNPGEFDMRAYLRRRDVHRVIFVRYREDGIELSRGGGNPILRAAHQSRTWLQNTLCRGLDDSPQVTNFISGITLGLRHQTPEDIEEPFQQTGTLHLFAVAGLHVGIVAQLLWSLAKVARFSQRWAAAIVIPLVFFYSAVTGLHISSVRAAIMTALFMGGYLVERKPFSLNSLAAAAMVLLCWNTNELFSTGFQLSFAVVGAIVLLVDPLKGLFRRYSRPDPFLPSRLLSAPRRVVDSLATALGKGASVSFAAWAGSLVLLFWYFHLVTPISLLANLVVVPIAYLILAVALLSILSAPLLPWISVLFNNANWLLARVVLVIVDLFAQLPAGHYYLAHPPWFGQAVAKICVLDVGPGAAVHLQTRHGHWLFDCGSERDYDRVVRPYLHACGLNSLHGLLLSHGDSGHIGGTEKVISDSLPSLLIDNPVVDRSSVHKRLQQMFDRRGLNVRRLSKGDGFDLGANARAVILHPPAGFSAPTADDHTFVAQIEVRPSTRILVMSDSGRATEELLLASGIDLRSQIVIKGQHHSTESGSEMFLRAVQPQLIIATSRDFPEHERISDEWADRVRVEGIKLFRQDETGAVEMKFYPDYWEARSYLTGETFRSSSR